MDSVCVQEEQLMHRFYADPDCVSGDQAVLSPEDARHALTVLRMKTGQPVEIIANGRRWNAVIGCTDNQSVSVRFISQLPSTEAKLSVTLFQGLPKADKMDLIIQKATELGVSAVVPVLMNRCVSRPDAKDIKRKLERWRKIAREAGKQCGRCVIPEILEPAAVDRLPGSVGLPAANVVPWENASGYGPLAFRRDHPELSSLGILIGPEGGIEKEEIDLLRSFGFTTITLGKRILRTETAGLAAVSSFMSLYGEME